MKEAAKERQAVKFPQEMIAVHREDIHVMKKSERGGDVRLLMEGVSRTEREQGRRCLLAR